MDQATSAIRACSYLDEVAIALPRALHRRFRRLGVFEEDDVLGLAKGDATRALVGLRFSFTEVFPQPVDRGCLNKLWSRERGKQFNPVSAIEASHSFFQESYLIGTGRK